MWAKFSNYRSIWIHAVGVAAAENPVDLGWTLLLFVNKFQPKIRIHILIERGGSKYAATDFSKVWSEFWNRCGFEFDKNRLCSAEISSGKPTNKADGVPCHQDVEGDKHMLQTKLHLFSMHCMSKKSWPNLYINLLHIIGQDFLDTQWQYTLFVNIFI